MSIYHKKICEFIIFSFAYMGLCTGSYASNYSSSHSSKPVSHPPGSSVFFTLTAGGSIVQETKGTNYIPVQLFFYDYRPLKTNSNKAVYGASIGKQFRSAALAFWKLDLGIGYQSMTFFPGGTLLQGVSIPSAERYTYSYKLHGDQVLVESKLLFNISRYVNPYVFGGVGASFNNAFKFKTTVPFFFEYTPSYASNRETSFSYGVGAGVDLNLSERWVIGAGYRFADLGRVSLGAGTVDVLVTEDTLKQSHAYYSQVLLQLKCFLF